MIAVTVTLHPSSGVPRQVLARLYITNDGTGDKERGNYDLLLTPTEMGDKRIPFATGTLQGFDRRLGAIKLVTEALKTVDLIDTSTLPF